MIQKILTALMVVLLVGGCATPGNETATVTPGESTTADTDMDARGRARIHTDLAAGYLEQRNMRVALEEVLIAQRSDATYGPAYTIGGLVYAELKDDRTAEQNFQQALRLNSRDPDANNSYATFLCQRKREAEGIRYFLAAAANPLYSYPDRSYASAGVCARRRGDLAEAEGYFRTSLKLQPNQIQALYQLADISYGKGNFVEARGYLQRLVPVASSSSEILWLMVRTERRAGDRNSEASYAYQLRQNFPNSKEAQALAAGQFE